MNDRISARAMRDRLLAGLQRSRPDSDDWVAVLAAPGNRQLLGLIGRRRPGSIGELADLADRAQPNISRSLSALAAAGLVEVRAEGRRSVPSLTALGRAKAAELDLLDPLDGPPHRPMEDEASEDALFSTDFDPAGHPLPADTEAVFGRIGHRVRRHGAREAETGFWKGDLVLPSIRLAENWWRLLYRRDAPFRLLDLEIGAEAARVSLSVRSLGGHVDLFLRWEGDDRIEREPEPRLTVAGFEKALLDEWLGPVGARQRALRWIDTPLQSHLTRLADSMADPDERTFCRTAGALGLSPHGLDGATAAAVRDLVAAIEEEDARLDFASAVLSDGLAAGRLWANREIEDRRASNRLHGLADLRRGIAAADRLSRPWRKGRDLARMARSELGLAPDRSLGGLEGIAQRFGAECFDLSSDAPGGIRGFQSMCDAEPVVVVEDEGAVASAFVLARAIGDYLAFGSANACVADLYTDRQAVGRAFAAEFLAPGAGVTAMIDEGEPPFRVQAHYGVSPEVVRRQYENFDR